MNVHDNVRRAFRSKYSFDIQTTWLQACITWLRDQFQLPDLTNNYALEKIYNQWLHTDISLIADAQSLPNDLDLNAKKVQLSGKYALQVIHLTLFHVYRRCESISLYRLIVFYAYLNLIILKLWIYMVIKMKMNELIQI
jgi:hypothetical protein